MKKRLEISLKTLHVGAKRRVVTLKVEDDDSVNKDLLALYQENESKFKKLKTAMRVISEHEHYSNEQKFKNLKHGLYEIKIDGYRVYAFLDQHQNSTQQLIICSLCAKKTKQQNSDIKNAREIRKKYLTLTQQDGIQPKLELLPNETNE